MAAAADYQKTWTLGNLKVKMSAKIPSEHNHMTQPQPFELLKQARSRFTQREIAEHVGKDAKTVRRWEKGETPCPAMLEPALRDMLETAQPTGAGPIDSRFRFIDLFAGIGGIRLGFEAHGGECVFTSEWNDFSKKTYIDNFGGHHPFVGDIVPFPAENVPSHDVLLAGFPCQPFSIAGVSKKNSLGRPHGFECTTQGTLFSTLPASSQRNGPQPSCWKT